MNVVTGLYLIEQHIIYNYCKELVKLLIKQSNYIKTYNQTWIGFKLNYKF